MSCNCGNNQVVIPSPKQIVRGAVGLSKVALSKAGIIDDNADAGTVKHRIDTCRECEYSTKNNSRINRPSKGLTNYSQCSICACLIKFKAELKSSSCPLSKWDLNSH